MTYIIPILHPAYVTRGQWALGEVQPYSIALAREIAETGTYEMLDPTVPPEGANIYPSLRDLEVFSSRISSYCSVDIECAGDYLVCVGICHLSSEEYVCVRFRHGSEDPGALFEPEDLEERALWLFEFLADDEIKKVYHNGYAFDIPYLEGQGFVVNGFANDTMLQGFIFSAELPKKLNFSALTYCGIPNWKTLVREKDEEKEN